MTSPRSSLDAVTAADLMTKQVLTLDPALPVARALAQLGEYDVSGAPVVDAAGHVIGVFSARNVSSNLDEGLLAARVETLRAEAPLADDGDADEELPPVEDDELELGGASVADWMTPDVASVAPTASLRQVCQKLVEARAHRVLVLDRRQIVGIVSTMDIVRHLAR